MSVHRDGRGPGHIARARSTGFVGTPGVPIPANTVLPAITGTTTSGSVLTCSTGTWTNTPTSFAYQWTSGGINVGTNASTYTEISGDVGNTIACQVTATNTSGSGQATAAAVGPVTAGASTAALKFNLASNSQYTPLLAF